MLAGVRDRWQRDPRAGALVVVAGFALAGFVAMLAAVMLAPSFERFDLSVSTAIRSTEIPSLRWVAVVLTHVGDFWPMAVLTALTAIVLYARGRRTSAVTLALAVMSGSAFGWLMKLFVQRLRPVFEMVSIPIPRSYSFPSGHALTSLLFFGSLVILIMLHVKKLRTAVVLSSLCVLAALSVSMSRVYVGVHYLGDVVASWLLGIGWLALVVLVSARWGAGSEGDDATRRAAA